jgi:hypothetical protein
MESFGAPGLFRTQAIAVEQDFACQEVDFTKKS